MCEYDIYCLLTCTYKLGHFILIILRIISNSSTGGGQFILEIRDKLTPNLALRVDYHSLK